MKKDSAIQFEVESSQDEKKEEKAEKKEEEDKEKKEDEKEKKEEAEAKKPEKPKKKIFYFEYVIATGKLIQIEDYEKPPEKPRWASISPDGETILFGRNYNLFWMDKENYEKALKDEKDKDIEEHQLTEDGEEYYSYAGSDA